MVKKKIWGTKIRPRLSVFRSLKHIRAQIINDEEGVTLASASSLEPEAKSKAKPSGKKDVARVVGEALGKRAQEKGVKKVVFDRGSYLYHGRVKALAEGCRTAGLEF